ncbi:hypothetical protein EV182_003472 [Spiromyces aspiralis]|uniref:Uncharacterized protein n=1 Tax=Spiromyces aspiralis TaxID=68401 RepID=A0ACC1HWH8_9FUNG|nr:hypothetical protein EV182_003472 [Spiromyces aspiralis]
MSSIMSSVTLRYAHKGIWGDITSSVDWCEENYEWTPYIAEFFNSFSSFAMIILGEIAAQMNCTGYVGFTVMSRIVTLVGIGSFMFHATLKYHMQMLDEVPMLWAILSAFYIQTKIRYNIQSRWFLIATVGWGCFITFLTAGFSGKTQFFLFHASFGTLVHICFYYMYQAYKGLKLRGRDDLTPLFHRGVVLYIIAVICWLIDTNLCPFVNGTENSILPINPQLHAWWHIVVSAGLYYLIVLFMGDYCTSHNIPIRLTTTLSIFPYISVCKVLDGGIWSPADRDAAHGLDSSTAGSGTGVAVAGDHLRERKHY